MRKLKTDDLKSFCNRADEIKYFVIKLLIEFNFIVYFNGNQRQI